MSPHSNPRACLLFAGQIASGKSTIARLLSDDVGAHLVSVRAALAEMTGSDPNDRRTLQERGSLIDRRTNGRWLYEFLVEHQERHLMLVVDSLRTLRQTIPILEQLSGSQLIYLDASEGVRRARFAQSQAADPLKRSLSFDTAMQFPTESAVTELRSLAEVVIDNSELSEQDCLAELQGAIT